MSCPKDIPAVPSLQDQFCDSNARGFGFADEQPADAFPPEPEYTPEEQLHQRYLARLEDERRAAACVAAFKPLADAAEAVRRKLEQPVQIRVVWQFHTDAPGKFGHDAKRLAFSVMHDAERAFYDESNRPDGWYATVLQTSRDGVTWRSWEYETAESVARVEVA